MDPKKAAAEWWRSTVFKEEAIRPQPTHAAQFLPPLLRAARSLEDTSLQPWRVVFLQQAKLLVDYEDDYADCIDYTDRVTPHYPTYQSCTDRQLRSYFSWRTKLRHGELSKVSLPYALIYVYELLNQIGVADPEDGYGQLERFRDEYSRLDPRITTYMESWLRDYVIYYDLDPSLLAETPQAVFDRDVATLDQIRKREPGEVMEAVKRLAPTWLQRSKFYGANQPDMDAVIVRVLNRISEHYALRSKKTMVDQIFGSCCWRQTYLFGSAVFCDPLKRKNYEYRADEQWVYTFRLGVWEVRSRILPTSPNKKLSDLIKAIDSVMREEYGFGSPIQKAEKRKWVLRIIEEEVRRQLEEKKAAEAKKVAIDFTQLKRIRRDAAITQEKLSVEEETEELSTREEEPAAPAPVPQEDGEVGDLPLAPAEYRLLRCLLYGGDMDWVRTEGCLVSVLADGINEKLYDLFQDCVLDDTSQLVEDYADDLKEMVHP